MKICMASQSFHPYIGGVSNYRDEDLRCKMGQAARDKAQRYFSRERGVKQYLNLYHEALNN